LELVEAHLVVVVVEVNHVVVVVVEGC